MDLNCSSIQFGISIKEEILDLDETVIKEEELEFNEDDFGIKKERLGGVIEGDLGTSLAIRMNNEINNRYIKLERLRPKENNNDKDKLVCEYCTKCFKKRNDFTRHLNSHRGYKPYCCTVCSKKFVAKSQLNAHRQTHESNRKRPHRCYECPKKFYTKADLKKHLNIHRGYKPHSCNVCNKKFVRKSHLNYHIQTHESNREKLHLCSMCSQSFYSNSDLKKHKNIHKQRIQFPCNSCPKVFNQSRNLQEHINGVHKRMYQCTLCGKHLAAKCYLKTHMVNVHSEFNVFSCPICKKEFKKLKRHISRVHSGIKKVFSCSQCPATFTEKQNLKAHLECVHFSLKRYCCDECGSKFYRKMDLVVHMRRHNRIKLFHCTICNEKFVSKSEVTKHTGSHSDERNFSCPQCPATYKWKYHVKRHLESVHSR